MQSFSLYFVFAMLVGGGLLWAAHALDQQEVSEFYGFAQTEETEINFNYPIEIQEILVQAGAVVQQDDILMRVKRARPKETLADQNYRIDELKAEERVDIQRIDSKLAALQQSYTSDKLSLKQQAKSIQDKIGFRERLLESLSEQDQTAIAYSPMQTQLAAISDELQQLESAFKIDSEALRVERRLLMQPYLSARERLAAERDFDAGQLELLYDIKAPANGVIGNINAKIAEHKSSFSPLIIFYEPNPREVRAYIHEEKILEAQLGDTVYVSSITSQKARLPGVITGLGSRVVSVPSRLRRMPDIEIYGREVIISISPDNQFLQSEKVRISFKKPGL